MQVSPFDPTKPLSPARFRLSLRVSYYLIEGQSPHKLELCVDNSDNNQPVSWRLFFVFYFNYAIGSAIISAFMEGEDFSPNAELVENVIVLSIWMLAFWIFRRYLTSKRLSP